MSKINHGTIKVLRNAPLNDRIYNLKFSCEDLSDMGPGQFIMLDCVTKEARQRFVGSPLLKRPFSIYLADRDKYEFEILYKDVGVGTSELKRLKKGDEAYILGPLGKTIDVEALVKTTDKGITLVGGGVGIAPLTFLLQSLVEVEDRILVYFGAYELDNFMMTCIENLNGIIHSRNVHVICEKGTGEYRRLVGNTIRLFNHVEGFKLQTTTVVCGPEVMMEKMYEFSKGSLYDCYGFIERRMACGIGVCLSCNIGGKQVCKDGPFFNLKEVF